MVPLLVEPDTALLQGRTLCAPNRGSIPVAAWYEDGVVLLHGVYQDQVASTVQLHREYGVAVERLTYCTSRTIDESTLLVEVTGKSHLATRSSENPQRRLRSGIAQIPPRHLF